MINKKILIKSGYKEFKTGFFQKCIRDNNGERYYINIEYYDLTKELKGHKVPKSVLKGYTCTFQFQNTKISGIEYFCPNFEMDVTKVKIDDLQRYIEKLWIASGCPYYEEC